MKVCGHYLVAIIALHAMSGPIGRPGRPRAETPSIHPRHFMTGRFTEEAHDRKMENIIVSLEVFILDVLEAAVKGLPQIMAIFSRIRPTNIRMMISDKTISLPLSPYYLQVTLLCQT